MLLDTHVLLWFLDNNSKLPPKVKKMIEEGDNIVVSIVTLWEIAIKLSIKKLDVQFEFQDLVGFLGQLEITLLPLCFEDTQCYINLPLHHRDPFDRILISQAINNSLAIVSVDAAFDAYPIQRVWA
jgi:PIN domain nuclease of toxin-antitoxin system